MTLLFFLSFYTLGHTHFSLEWEGAAYLTTLVLPQSPIPPYYSTHPPLTVRNQREIEGLSCQSKQAQPESNNARKFYSLTTSNVSALSNGQVKVSERKGLQKENLCVSEMSRHQERGSGSNSRLRKLRSDAYSYNPAHTKARGQTMVGLDGKRDSCRAENSDRKREDRIVLKPHIMRSKYLK